MRLTSLAALFLIGPMAGAHAGALVFVDGDFSAPVPKAGSFVLLDTGSRYGSWRVVGEAGTVAFVSGSYVHDGINFLAEGTTSEKQTHSVWVNLAAVSKTTTGLVHAPTTTVVGTQYTVTFWVGNVVDPNGVYGSSSSVKVYENATLLGTATNTAGAGTSTETWQQFKMVFTAEATSTQLAFINGDPANDMNCGIDSISIKEAKQEPAGQGTAP